MSPNVYLELINRVLISTQSSHVKTTLLSDVSTETELKEGQFWFI